MGIFHGIMAIYSWRSLPWWYIAIISFVQRIFWWDLSTVWVTCQQSRGFLETDGPLLSSSELKWCPFGRSLCASLWGGRPTTLLDIFSEKYGLRLSLLDSGWLLCLPPFFTFIFSLCVILQLYQCPTDILMRLANSSSTHCFFLQLVCERTWPLGRFANTLCLSFLGGYLSTALLYDSCQHDLSTVS